MTPEYFQSGKEFIVYDASAMNQPWPGMFDPQAWFEHGPVTPVTGGRGAAWHVRRGSSEYALRHYRRGGYMARVVSDLYLWNGLHHSRAFREWKLLAELYQRGLPVTPPFAARVVRHGLFYRAAILTRWLPGTRTLAGTLGMRELSTPEWRRVGATLRRFHDAGACHADLNAWNILLDDRAGVHLVDFDRGTLRIPADAWQQANLARLQRSLERLRAKGVVQHYQEVDWEFLMSGYRG